MAQPLPQSRGVVLPWPNQVCKQDCRSHAPLLFDGAALGLRDYTISVTSATDHGPCICMVYVHVPSDCTSAQEASITLETGAASPTGAVTRESSCRSTSGRGCASCISPAAWMYVLAFVTEQLVLLS